MKNVFSTIQFSKKNPVIFSIFLMELKRRSLNMKVTKYS